MPAADEAVERVVVRTASGDDLTAVSVERMPLPRVEPAPLPVAGIAGRDEILRYLDRLLTADASSLCVVVVEFANLRKLNESLGFERGDLALAELAHRIRAAMPAGEPVGRISGKGFLISCGLPRSAEQARERARHLVDQWSGPMIIDGVRIDPVLAAAVVWASDSSTALTLLREADIALSLCNVDADSPVVVFEEEMATRALRRFVLEDELRFGLDAGEFELFFQPIVHLPSATPVAAEALVRWRHPREGILTPETFMPVAEESRLIRPMGRVVLAQALEALASLPPHTIQVGVNVSAVELSDHTWMDTVTDAIERSGVDPACLVVEITETAVLAASRDVGSDLRRLRSMGVGIFLDDFGTGYSSLSLLRDLPVTGIKLDKSFVAALVDPDSFGSALARGILDLVRPLGLTGVAEGIETPQHATRLAELGWEFGQGYLYGRPAPFNELPPIPVPPPDAPPS